ncbi:tape measure protein [Sphingomonas sp. CJ99]
MRLSLILEAVDRITAPVRRVEASMKRLTDRAIKPVERALQRVDAVEKRVLSNRLINRVEQLTTRVARLARIGGSWAMEKAAYGAGYAIGWTIRQATQLALRIAQLGALTAAGGAAWFVGGIVSTGASFEQMQVQLEGTLGGAAKAKEALAWVREFAKQTPYELEEVTQAFVRSYKLGINPMSGALRDMGDAAGANAKQLIDAIEAVGDAQNGEFERLKEFNITSSSKGGTVVFTYFDKAQKEARKAVPKTKTAIQQAVLEIFRETSGGGMARQSTTLIGLWANLMDTVKGFQLDIANAGIFDLVKSKVDAILKSATRLAEDGTLAAWAETISDRMEELVERAWKFTTETDWQAVIDGLGGIANALITVVGLIGSAISGVRRFRLEADLRNANATVNSWAPWTTDADRRAARSRAWDIQSELDRLDGKNTGPVSLNVRDATDRKKLWLQPASSMAPASKPGKLEISIRTDRGTEAWPSKMAPGSTPLSVNTGRPMWGDQ